MGHWKRLIEIPGGTDCYYWINNMTCPIHVFYCLVVHVPVPDHLAAIMLRVYFVTLPGTCYTFCGGILLMYMYTLHCIHSVFCIGIITVYAQHRIVVILHMPICMFISITSPLDNTIYV